jgi:hypothetical protein
MKFVSLLALPVRFQAFELAAGFTQLSPPVVVEASTKPAVPGTSGQV